MLFTVIIATCNRPDRLANALAAVRVAIEAAGGSHHVVVADNGTKRPAHAITSQFAQSVPFPVTHVQTPPLNKAAALNAGIRAARTDWLAFTDDDCLPDRDWLAAGCAYATAAGVNLFSGRLQAAPVDFKLPRWLPVGHDVLPWSPAFVDFAPLASSGVLNDRERVPFGANIFVRKWVFDTYGGYDEPLWNRCGTAALGSEDAEFAMRVRARGEAIGYCADALVVHPVYPERATLNYYLRHIYHAGVREPLFAEPGQRAPLLYLARNMIVALIKCAAQWLRRDFPHAAVELMNAARDWGEIRGWLRLGSGGDA